MKKHQKGLIEKIAIVERNTEEFISQIELIADKKSQGLIKFILICSLIDAVATYSEKKGRNNRMYKNFINSYLGRVNSIYKDKYIQNKLYGSIRCSLVHSFTISSGVLLCQINDTNLHLSTNPDGYLIVDLDSLFKDIKKAIIIYFKKLRKGNDDIQKMFRKAYSKNKPFAVYKNVSTLAPNETLTGMTESPAILIYDVVNFRRKKKHN